MSLGTATDDFRRKWDTAEYEQRAKKRAKGEDPDEEPNDDEIKEAPKKKEHLRPHEQKIDLESRVGKTVVVNKTTPSSQAGGFYCDVCDCVVKDSVNYLDHINGKKHQKNLGFTMKVKRSTLEEVKARFELKKRERDQGKKEYDLKERLRELKEEEEKVREYRKEKRKEKKLRKSGQLTDEAPTQEELDMASMMGFKGFGSTKK